MGEGLFRKRKVLFMKIKYLPLILSLSALLVACGGNSSSNTSSESKQGDSSSLTSEDSKESETSAESVTSDESSESPVESGDSSEEQSEPSVDPSESSEESSEEASSSEEEVDWYDLACELYSSENLAYSDTFPAEAFTDATLPEAPAFLEDLDYGFAYTSFEGDEETWKYALIVMEATHEEEFFDLLSANDYQEYYVDSLFGSFSLVVDEARESGLEFDISLVYADEADEEPSLLEVYVYDTNDTFGNSLTSDTAWSEADLKLMNDCFGFALPFLKFGINDGWTDYSEYFEEEGYGDIYFNDGYLYDLSEDYIELLVADGFVLDDDGYYTKGDSEKWVSVDVGWSDVGNFIDVYFSLPEEEEPEQPEIPGEGDYVNVLTGAGFGTSGSNYNTLTYTAKNGVSYKAVAAGTYDSIQLRGKSGSGLTMTSNPNNLVIDSITVVFNAETYQIRVLDVYADTKAFDISAMYDGSAKMAGSIQYDQSTNVLEYTFDDFPEGTTYFGVRSHENALYIDALIVNFVAAE